MVRNYLRFQGLDVREVRHWRKCGMWGKGHATFSQWWLFRISDGKVIRRFPTGGNLLRRAWCRVPMPTETYEMWMWPYSKAQKTWPCQGCGIPIKFRKWWRGTTYAALDMTKAKDGRAPIHVCPNIPRKRSATGG